MTPHPDNDDTPAEANARVARFLADRRAPTDSDGAFLDSPRSLCMIHGYEYDDRGLRWRTDTDDARPRPTDTDSAGTPEPSPVWATPFDEAAYFDRPTRSPR